MAPQLIAPLLVGTCVVLVVMAFQAFARRTAHLDLGLFRPYRGDPWPIGVQEDDDFRFTWTPRLVAATGSAPDRPNGAGTAGPEGARDSVETIDDLAAGAVAVARLGRVRVGQARAGRSSRS